MVKILHYFVFGVILLGAVYYVWTKPPTINPMIDRRSADALAMVQTHRALGHPTILQAMTEHVRSMKDRGLNARLGEWRVKQVDGDLYEVRVQLRDKGVSGQWFEREFIWHANLSLKRVNAASLPADGITPNPAENDDQPGSPQGRTRKSLHVVLTSLGPSLRIEMLVLIAPAQDLFDRPSPKKVSAPKQTSPFIELLEVAAAARSGFARPQCGPDSRRP